MQYLAIPYAALDAVPDDAGRLVVLALYREAHGARWGWLRWTIRQLALHVRADRNVVERVVHRLEDTGLLEREVVYVGGRRDGMRLRLVDPILKGDTVTDTRKDTSSDTRESGEAAEKAVTQTRRKTRGKTRRKTPYDLVNPEPDPIASEHIRQSSEQTTLELVPDPPPLELDEFETAAAYAGHVLNPAVGLRISNGPERTSQTGQRLARSVKQSLDKTMRSMMFIVESSHPTAQHNREHGYGLVTALRHRDEYAELYEHQPRERGYHPPQATSEPMTEERLQELTEGTGWT